jgi:hypothetical protein
VDAAALVWLEISVIQSDSGTGSIMADVTIVLSIFAATLVH